MTFAEKLKAIRAKAGLTQAGLAQASGLGLGTIRDYEQGAKEPVLRSAIKLARALGVAVEAFADDDKPAEKPGRKAPGTLTKGKKDKGK